MLVRSCLISSVFPFVLLFAHCPPTNSEADARGLAIPSQLQPQISRIGEPLPSGVRQNASKPTTKKNATPSNQQIAEELARVFRKLLGAPGEIQITVQDGTVELDGFVMDAKTRTAIIAATKNHKHVNRVISRIKIDPTR